MKLIAFAASSSKQSINKQFAEFAISILNDFDTELLDLNDYELPLYSVDREKADGIPDLVGQFCEKLNHADIIVISLSEHNGTYTAVFKNLFDWLSRYKLKMFENKKLVLLSAAAGPRGGQGVMDAALQRFPIHGAEIIGQFCLPKFKENFDSSLGIINENLSLDFAALLDKVKMSALVKNQIKP